jgi:hypothetical protein
VPPCSCDTDVAALQRCDRCQKANVECTTHVVGRSCDFCKGRKQSCSLSIGRGGLPANGTRVGARKKKQAGPSAAVLRTRELFPLHPPQTQGESSRLENSTPRDAEDDDVVRAVRRIYSFFGH